MEGLSERGRSRRLAQLLRAPHGRSVVVAIDHGQFMGVVPGAEVLRDAVGRVLDGRPDALQLTVGSVRRCGDLPAFHEVPLVLRLDTTNVWREGGLPPSPGYWAPLTSPAEALRCGASVAVAFLLGGWDDDELERENLKQLATWSRECDALGLPFMIEPLPLSGKLESASDARLVRTLSRIAAEIGCDVLKVDYSGDAEAFAELVADAGVPVLARGGPKATTAADYLNAVASAVAAGASGVVVGRNVFDQDHPHEVLRDLRDVVHQSEKESPHV
jgi:DhnA family fructose-bisphosphate aldolase class Ia